MPLNGKRGGKMATSSITANFYTDDPTAANKIVHALFTPARTPQRMPKRRCFEVKRTPAGERAFFKRLVKKAQLMKAGA